MLLGDDESDVSRRAKGSRVCPRYETRIFYLCFLFSPWRMVTIHGSESTALDLMDILIVRISNERATTVARIGTHSNRLCPQSGKEVDDNLRMHVMSRLLVWNRSLSCWFRVVLFGRKDGFSLNGSVCRSLRRFGTEPRRRFIERKDTAVTRSPTKNRPLHGPRAAATTSTTTITTINTNGHASAPVAPISSPYRADAEWNCRVFVANLSYDVDSVNFKNHMEQVGTVVKVELPPKNQNHHNNQQQQQQHHLCKGHGVIEYATSQQAKKAIERLSGSMLLGRSILVRYDRPRDPLNFDGWPVRVDQLRPGTPWQVLKDHMRRAGVVKACNVYSYRDDGGDATTTASPTTTKPTTQWYGIVLYQNANDARRAVQNLHQSMLEWNDDRFPITVRQLEKRILHFDSNKKYHRPTIQYNHEIDDDDE